jgi:hypothetical protein
MPKTQAEIDDERYERWANSPFRPGRPSSNDPMRDVAMRIAGALEYIAVQLGQLNTREREKAGVK